MFFIRNQAAQEWSSLTKANIENLVYHCLGDHEKLDGKWCSGKLDASYKYKSLAYGRDLRREELKRSKLGLRKTCKKYWCI